MFGKIRQDQCILGAYIGQNMGIAWVKKLRIASAKGGCALAYTNQLKQHLEIEIILLNLEIALV